MTFESFVFDQPASRVIFGAGSLDRVGEEVRRLGVARAIVLSTPEQKDQAADVAQRLASFPRACIRRP